MINRPDFHLGDVRIEPLRGIIKVELEERRVEPQIMAVLLRLTDNPGEVVTREEMLNSVWPDCVVSDGVLSKAISILRKALGDNARNPLFIQTIPKVGYRLIAPVRAASAALPKGKSASYAQMAVIPQQAQKNSPLVKPYKSNSATRTALRYVWPAAIIVLLFMLWPKHIEIEEEITYLSPIFPIENATDSTIASVDSSSTGKTKLKYLVE